MLGLSSYRARDRCRAERKRGESKGKKRASASRPTSRGLASYRSTRGHFDYSRRCIVLQIREELPLFCSCTMETVDLSNSSSDTIDPLPPPQQVSTGYRTHSYSRTDSIPPALL